jgi:hypothetical protein
MPKMMSEEMQMPDLDQHIPETRNEHSLAALLWAFS